MRRQFLNVYVKYILEYIILLAVYSQYYLFDFFQASLACLSARFIFCRISQLVVFVLLFSVCLFCFFVCFFSLIENNRKNEFL